MADVALGKDDDAEEAAPEPAPKKRWGLKKLLLIAGVPVLLLGGAGGAYVAGVLDPLLGVAEPTGDAATAEGEAAQEGEVPAVQFFDVPDLLVNLNTNSRQNAFLKIQIALELDATADVAALTTLMPRVIDSFQISLRELRPEELKGSEGVLRLKQELLLRVNQTAAPVHVRDILFKSILVQ
jgi:flagellar FliL protein